MSMHMHMHPPSRWAVESMPAAMAQDTKNTPTAMVTTSKGRMLEASIRWDSSPASPIGSTVFTDSRLPWV